MMTADLQTLLDGLNTALRDHIRADSGLFDTEDQQPTPPDHYGNTAAALALAAGARQARAQGRQALLAWLAIDEHQIGHLPFNRLMLLLLQVVRDGADDHEHDRTLVDKGLSRCALRRNYPSNNWTLLAQTCRLIEAPSAQRKSEARRLSALLTRWTTEKGAFIDFPAHPRTGFSTPLAYHHKALFLAALACWFHDDAELARHARRLLDWLVHCWDPAGYAGGFGRSTHALFGDGCLIAALVLMGVEHGNGDEPVRALCQRLAAQRRTDGFLWLNPAGHDSGTASWDSYMHLSVYNAWAAAVMGIALHLRAARPIPESLRDTRWNAARTGFFHDEAAGLAYLRTPNGLNALISTSGQPPQSYSRTEADFRYAGGSIAHLRIADGPPLVAPALRVTQARLVETPALAGWTPLFKSGAEIVALDQFDSVTVELIDGAPTLRLAGRARAVFRPAPRGFLQQLLATIDWRFLRGRLGRRAALVRRTESPSIGELTLEIAPRVGGIAVSRHIAISASVPLVCLNPSGHTVIREGDAARDTPGRNGSTCVHISSSLPGGTAHALPPSVVREGAAMPALVLDLPATHD